MLLANFFLYINILYSMSAMSEPSRYAMAIVLSGMLYRQAFFDTGKFYRYVAMPVMCTFASLSYLILVSHFLIYLFLMCRDVLGKRAFAGRWNSVCSCLCILGVFVLYTYAMMKITGLFTPTYFQESALSLLERGDSYATVMGMLVHDIRVNLEKINLFSIAKAGGVSLLDVSVGVPKGYTVLWFALLCYVLTVYLLVFMLRGNTAHDRWIAGISFFILMVFVAGHVVLYGHASRSTLVRGINTAVCCVAYLAVLMKDRRLIAVFILMAAFYAPLFFHEMKFIQNQPLRYIPPDMREKIIAEEKMLEKQVCDTSATNPWDNTVAKFWPSTGALFVPSCLSSNLVTERGDNMMELFKKSKYVLFGWGDGAGAAFPKFLEEGYVIVGENELYVLLKRKE